MKLTSHMLLALGLFPALIQSAVAASGAANLDLLQGKWSVKKTNREGRSYTQTIELKKDRFAFTIGGPDGGEARFQAEGKVECSQLGPFQALRIHDIKAGRAGEALESVDEERSSIYVLGEGTLTMASNFDRQRENQPPSLEIYRRIATAQAAEDKLVGRWKLELVYGDTPREYELKIEKAEGKLAAAVISPRSGEHPCKSVSFKDGKLLMELDRDYDGNEMTFIYTGKLSGERLSGTVVLKGQEDQGEAQWTGTKQAK